MRPPPLTLTLALASSCYSSQLGEIRQHVQALRGMSESQQRHLVAIKELESQLQLRIENAERMTARIADSVAPISEISGQQRELAQTQGDLRRIQRDIQRSVEPVSRVLAELMTLQEFLGQHAVHQANVQIFNSFSLHAQIEQTSDLYLDEPAAIARSATYRTQRKFNAARAVLLYSLWRRQSDRESATLDSDPLISSFVSSVACDPNSTSNRTIASLYLSVVVRYLRPRQACEDLQAITLYHRRSGLTTPLHPQVSRLQSNNHCSRSPLPLPNC